VTTPTGKRRRPLPPRDSDKKPAKNLSREVTKKSFDAFEKKGALCSFSDHSQNKIGAPLSKGAVQ
jgi:hypothetical protein